MHQANDSIKRVKTIKGEQISPTDRYIGMSEVAKLCGISRTTIKRLMAKHQFPPSIYLTESREVWIESDVQEWRNIGGSQPFYEMYGKQLEQQAA